MARADRSPAVAGQSAGAVNRIGPKPKAEAALYDAGGTVLDLNN